MSSPALPFHLINAFTLPDSPHSGNQAAVVVLPSASHPCAKDDAYMQLVSRDFHFAETAWVYPLDSGGFSLRWFTPELEVELCGHATLAASSVLFSLHPDISTLTLHTRWAGSLTAQRASSPAQITIALPINPLEAPAATPESLTTFCDASGLEQGDVIQVTPFRWGTGSIIFELQPSVDLAGLKVDVKRFVNFHDPALIIVTQVKDPADARSGTLSIESRVFCPGIGVDEDSVTGAAHAVLTGYYLASPVSSRIETALPEGMDVQKLEIHARQLSLRGGALVCVLDGKEARITGTAVEMGRGTLAVLK